MAFSNSDVADSGSSAAISSADIQPFYKYLASFTFCKLSHSPYEKGKVLFISVFQSFCNMMCILYANDDFKLAL